MTKNYYAQEATEPTLFITKGRQRVKQYDGNIVYLKNGDEFELELFNPKSNKVLAKIKLNGKSLGSGIVLRPGERVFLERYLDEARKFQFETYEVDANDAQVRDAIRNNGEVEVEFFNESLPTASSYTITYSWPQSYHSYHHHHHYHEHIKSVPINPTWSVYSSIPIGGATGISGMSSSGGSVSFTGSTSANSCFSYTNSANAAPVAQQVETGIVDKGSYSQQSLTPDNSSFSFYMCNKVTWKILPESVRPYVREDLAVYCTSCGAKRKKSTHKFCPNCGTKF